MTWWVTVAAVRIHNWIQQTPKLSHMRGASRALSVRTSPTAVGVLDGFPSVEVKERESEVDGVVVATASDADTAAAYARALLGHLAHEIPGVQWESWWCEADSYVEAFSRFVDAFADGVSRLRRFPALLEAGPVMSCLMCRSEPAARAGGAVTKVVGDDDPEADTTQGAGCEVRKNEGTVNKGNPDSSDLRSQIPGKLAKDFAELARFGGVTPGSSGGALGRKESRNHLATVYADGNGMGAFFQALSSTTLPVTRLQGEAISALNTATRNAVAEAARKIATDPDTAAIEPHFVGGDDVLVSVPATYAWAFVAYLARYFEALRDTLHGLLAKDLDATARSRGLSFSKPLANEVSTSSTNEDQDIRKDPRAVELAERIDAISLGIGVTFAHASYPFAEAEGAAGAALKQAKVHARGQFSAIGWVDVTAQFAMRGRQPAYVLSAQQARDELDIPTEDETARAVFRLTPSARSQLAAILRDEPEATVRKVIAQWADRLEDKKLGKALLDLADAQQAWALLEPKEQKEKGSVEAVWADGLRADLSRARWWPNVNRKVER